MSAQVRAEDGKPPSLTATAHEQVLELGTAADFGYCQSNCKARRHCPLWHPRPRGNLPAVVNEPVDGIEIVSDIGVATHTRRGVA